MKKVLRELTTPVNASILVKEEVASQFVAPFHFHQGYEFTFIVKGHGKFYGGDRLLNFSEGDIYLFGIGFPHYFVNDQSFVDSGEMAHSIIVQFKEDFLGHDFYLKPEFKGVKELLKLAHRGIKVVNPTTYQREKFFELNNLTGLKALIGLIQLLESVLSPTADISMISTAVFANDPQKLRSSTKLESVYQYVLKNFKSDVNTKEAANLACMNEAAFCRYFKRRTDKTLSQFVNNVRITHATSLLAEKELSISAICFESGFDNLSYFNRQFKAITGKTPLAYRKEFS